MEELQKFTGKGMSSKRIAEVTGKDHSNVLRDIRNMVQDLQTSDSDLNPKDYQVVKGINNMTSEVILNERLSLCLAAGYSVSLRMKIIDDWASMKSHQLPKTFAESLRLLAQAEEDKERAQLQLEAQKPAVEFFNAVADSTDTLSIGDTGKLLGIGQNKLFEFLRKEKVLMSNNRPYQVFVTAGYFKIIEQKFDKSAGGAGINIKTFVLQRGVDYIRKKLNN